MKRTTILLSALLCLSVQINAQGLLKSLKNKAVNALTEKVVNKVKGKNQPTSSGTPSATTSPSFSESAKVEQMEQELSSKVNAWMNENDKTWNDEMPAFWVEGRKAQNAVIDKWNTQQAEKWNAVVKKHIDAAMPDAQKFVNLATELQTLEDNNADVGYKLAYNDAQKACMTLGVLMLKPLLQMPAFSLDMPKVSHTPTENGI